MNSMMTAVISYVNHPDNQNRFGPPSGMVSLQCHWGQT